MTEIKNIQKNLELNLFNYDQLEEIHLATLEVLNSVGVNVFEQEAIDLLKKAGAEVNDSLVKIPSSMVDEALNSAPCRVNISNRNGEDTMILEKNRSYFGTGSATQYTIDIEDNSFRTAVKNDVVNAARVADYLKNVDFVMSMALASDVESSRSFVHEFEAIVLNTIKPILYCADNKEDLLDIINIAEIISGGAENLKNNPFLLLYAEPSSPLQHGLETIRKLLICAEKKLPVICGPAVMMGATGPVTPAGSMVIANCEILSGLVIHQLKNAGAPFIYGGGIPPIDMKTSLCSYGAPEEHLNSAAMVKMAQYYDLPIFTTAGCSDSYVFDQQAGMEAGFNLLVHGLAGSNLIHDLGYIGAGAASSMEMLMLCNEIVGMVRHVLNGIEVNHETLALEVIKKVGPGGNFFAEEHTFKNFKKHMFFPELLNRDSYDKWETEGSSTYGKRANKKVKEILSNHQVSELPNEVIKKVKEITSK